MYKNSLFKKVFSIVLCFALLAVTIPSFTASVNAAGNTFYVSETGSDSNSGDTVNPFATIQKGLDAMTDGDTLVIKGGTYEFTATTSPGAFLCIKDKNFTNGIKITGEDNATIKTNIAGSTKPATGSGSNATFGIINSGNIEISGINFSGITYQASGTWDHIFINSSSNVSVHDCTFTGSSRVSGMVVYKSSSAQIYGNVFSMLRDHTIQLNSSAGSNKIYNNLFNGASRGIAIYSGGQNNVIVNNTFAGNAEGDIVYYNAPLASSNTFKNNIFTSGIWEINSGANNHSISSFIEANTFTHNLFNVADETAVVGRSADGSILTYAAAAAKGYFASSMAASPGFAAGGYTLADDSPCINKGDPSVGITKDILGNARDAAPDIGAYENQSSAGGFEVLAATPSGSAVKITESIQISFNAAVNAGSTAGRVTVVKKSDSSMVPADITVSDKTILLTNCRLENSTEYMVTVLKGITDADGKALSGDFSWSFVTEAAPDYIPNCLQVGGLTSTKAFGCQNIGTPASGDFFIQFDYMYPSGQNMAGFYVFSSFEGAYKQPVITQTGNTLAFKCGSDSYSMNYALKPDTWYNMTLHFMDSYFEMYIDGVRQNFSNGSSNIAIASGQVFNYLGYIGDLSGRDPQFHEGAAYYDNFKVIKNGLAAFEQSFDDGKAVNWTLMSVNTGADDIFGLSTGKLNCEAAEVASISLKGENNRTGFMVNSSGNIIVSGRLTNGKSAVLGLGKVDVKSSDSSIAAVARNTNGTWQVTGKGVGSAILTAEVIIGGKYLTAQLPVQVTEAAEIYGMAFEHEQVNILVSGTATEGINELYTDGTVKTGDLAAGTFTAESEDPDIASASIEAGKVVIKGLREGSTKVNLSGMAGTKPFTSSITVNVLGMNSVSARISHTVLCPGDSKAISVKAYASNGEVINNSLLEVSFSSDNESTAVVEGGKVVAKGPGTAKITAAVKLQSKVLTGQFGVKVEEIVTAKTRSTVYTAAKLANVKDNLQKYEWAQSLRKTAVEQADKYVALGYDKLWDSVTSQMIPRSYAVTDPQSKGCLCCGAAVAKYGNYPYIMDYTGNPWKITCPNCKKTFPTNDFNAYYNGGLDADGCFDPVLAKQHNDELIAKGGKGNLVNILYPEMGESWGVDDGTGYVAEDGQKYTFIAYYNHFAWYSGIISQALNVLKDAYLYTGDVKYANTGVVLLDRIADVYPQLNLDIWHYQDGFLNSNGHCNKGKAIGSIWETGLADIFLKAYDVFYPVLADDTTGRCQGALDYLASKEASKSNPKRIRKNIEDGIVRQIFPAVKNGEIRGNSGMHQATLALAAVVIDSNPETKEWLDFDFKTGTTSAYGVTGGNIYTEFVNAVDRDGNGDEGAPGYNSLWLSRYMSVAEVLDGYSIEGMESVDLYRNVKFQKMFYSLYPLTLCDIYSPSIGDTGKTGNPGLSVSLSTIVTAYAKYRDPILAQVAYLLNGNSADNIKLGIFDQNPEAIAADIKKVIAEKGVLDLGGTNITGYGFAAVRDGEAGDKLVLDGTEIPFNSMPVRTNTASTPPVKYFESNGTLQFEADTPGNYIEFDFRSPAAVTKTLYINMWTASTYGIYEVYLNGVKLRNISFQGAGIAVKKIGEATLVGGTNTIRFVLTDQLTTKKAGFRSLTIANSTPADLKESTQRDIWMYYGRTYSKASHGHQDALNLGLHAFNIDLMPDLGYPRFADENDKHRRSLVSNTISHNTVVVDGTQQNSQIVGQPLHFDQGGLVKLIDIDSKSAYESKADTYRRTSAMIKIDSKNSYVVDLFRVSGGTSHLYSFHGAETNSIATNGLSLEKQADEQGNYVGTYAGRNFTYDNSVADPTGFKYFFNVERQTGNIGDFSVDYNVVDTWNVKGEGTKMPTDIHLKLTMLGSFNEVALSDAAPPENKEGNPAKLRYVFAKREGTDLKSCFTSIIEPYSGQSNIASVKALTVKEGGNTASDMDVRAVRVTLANGRTDYIVNALDNTRTYTVTDGSMEFTFKGFMGVMSVNGDCKTYYINDGVGMENRNCSVPASVKGTVTDFTRELSTSNEITIKADNPDVNLKELAGRYIYIENDGIRNSAYQIVSASRVQGNDILLNIGNVSPVASYLDSSDFSKGFAYDIAEGKAFTIPLSDEYSTNNVPTDITLSSRQIEENNAPGAVVGTLSAEDADAWDSHTFELCKGAGSDDNNAFTVEGNVLKAVKSFDYETKNEYSIRVRTTDKCGAVFEKILTVRIKNAYEALPDNNTPDHKPAEQKPSEKPSKAVMVTSEIGNVSVPAEILDKLGTADAGKIKISAVSEAAGEGFKLRVIASYDGKTAEIADLCSYITVRIPATAGTAVVVHVTADGRKIPVPTKIITENGKIYAEIHTLATGSFKLSAGASVVDAASSWAKDYVNVLAGKLIIHGNEQSEYNPDKNITRAEYAVIMQNALGLVKSSSKSFPDVKKDDWYYDAMMTAVEYGLIQGYDNGNLGAADTLSREQAMVILSKAMDILNIKVTADSKVLMKFADSDSISGWARDGAAKLVTAGIVSGSGGMIHAKDSITKAEVAKLVVELLKLARLN